MTQQQENSSRIEKLERHHHVDAFDCGQENLNCYLQNYALMRQRADAARTYVGIAEEKIIAYYTLVVSNVTYEDVPDRLKKGLSRNPVPSMLLARLATDLESQGKGVGAGLLRDAMQRTIQVADIAGVRAFIVHAKNDEAKAFYQHFDFIPSPTDPYHLHVLVKDIRQMMCQHFSGHKVTQLFAEFRSPQVTNSHLQNEFAPGYKTPRYIQILPAWLHLES